MLSHASHIMTCTFTRLLLVLIFSRRALALWPLIPKRFTSNALIDAGPLGFEDLKGRIIAFGDFNGDQFLDIVTLSDDQVTLRISSWDHDSFQFVSQKSLVSSQKINNVVPGDYNRDGKLDLLVMSDSSSDRDALDMNLYFTGPDGSFSNPVSLASATKSQPITIDAAGLMKIDLLGFRPDTESGQPRLTLWNNTHTAPSSDVSFFFQTTDPQFEGSMCEFSNPHSNAVIDLDGDCLADIFVTCGSEGTDYQMWINHKEEGFKLTRTGSLPSGVGAVSFGDMNRDGTIDMVFPVCSSVSMSSGVGHGCRIRVVYNVQRPLCASTTAKKSGNDCRLPDELCSPDDRFDFNFDTSSSNPIQFVTDLLVSDVSPDGSDSLLLYDVSSSPALPLPLRVGDLNLDGYPDLVPIIVLKDGSTTPVLLDSRYCSKRDTSCHGPWTRTFSASSSDTEDLDEIKDARGVALLDLDEDGTLDLVIQRTGAQKSGHVVFIQNNIFHDAFFLKAIVLNGACNGLCSPANRSQPKYHPFGVSYSGPSYKYTILDTTGRRSAAQVGQLPQTSYHALHTPYSFFGLGRTNNYIENLFVGSTNHELQHFINMEGVIPNSRVVIIPPSRVDVDGAQDWRRELYLRPGEWIPWVTLTVVVATIVLAITVLVLHVNEKREDEAERRRKSHRINFDAL